MHYIQTIYLNSSNGILAIVVENLPNEQFMAHGWIMRKGEDCYSNIDFGDNHLVTMQESARKAFKETVRNVRNIAGDVVSIVESDDETLLTKAIIEGVVAGAGYKILKKD